MDNNNQLNNGNQLDPNAALNNQNYNNVANNQANYNNTAQNGIANNVSNTGNVGTTNTINNPNTTNNVSTNNEDYLKLDKVARQLASDFLVLGVFVVIILILSLLSGSFNFFNIIHLVIIVAGHSAAKELKPSAGVFGIIMGICLIISFNLIDSLLGIFILIRSIRYNALLKKV